MAVPLPDMPPRRMRGGDDPARRRRCVGRALQLGVADLFYDGKNDGPRAKLRIRFKQARPRPIECPSALSSAGARYGLLQAVE